MEKVTDKSAESLLNGFWVKWADQQIFDIGVTYSVKSIVLKFAQAYGEYRHEDGRRAGLEEAARAMCELCHSGRALVLRHGVWKHQSISGEIYHHCYAHAIWAIRAIAQPEHVVYSKDGVTLTNPPLTQEEAEIAQKTASVKIGETKTIIESLREALERPIKVRSEVTTEPDRHDNRNRETATGASEAAVKGALLASEVPHTPLPWWIRKRNDGSGEGILVAAPSEDHPYYGKTTTIDIIGDEDYPRKQADMKFIVECVNRPISPAAEQGSTIFETHGPCEGRKVGQPAAEGSAGQPHNLIHPTYISGCADCYEWQVNRGTSGYVQTGGSSEGPNCGHCGAVMTHVYHNKSWRCKSCGATTGATGPTEEGE